MCAHLWHLKQCSSAQKPEHLFYWCVLCCLADTLLCIFKMIVCTIDLCAWYNEVLVSDSDEQYGNLGVWSLVIRSVQALWENAMLCVREWDTHSIMYQDERAIRLAKSCDGVPFRLLSPKDVVPCGEKACASFEQQSNVVQVTEIVGFQELALPSATLLSEPDGVPTSSSRPSRLSTSRFLGKCTAPTRSKMTSTPQVCVLPMIGTPIACFLSDVFDLMTSRKSSVL